MATTPSPSFDFRRIEIALASGRAIVERLHHARAALQHQIDRSRCRIRESQDALRAATRVIGRLRE
jgi:hypothetical protein